MTSEELVQSSCDIIGKLEQNNNEIIQCVKYIIDLKPHNILEIGTRKGGTFHIWCSLATGKRISVDLCEEMSLEEVVERNKKINERFDRVYFIQGNSHDGHILNRVKKVLKGELLDFLFIDGEHINDGPEKDYQMYSPLVRAGGIIGFHDIGEMTNNGWGGHPYDDWQRIKKQYASDKIIEIIEQYDYKGIGLIKL